MTKSRKIDKRKILMFKHTITGAIHATKKALWLCSLISQILHIQLNTITLFSNNQSVIVLATDYQYYLCTKHIDMLYYFIC